MYQYHYQWLVYTPKTPKKSAVERIRQLHDKEKMSRRSSINAIRVIMEFGITREFATALLDGKEILS